MTDSDTTTFALTVGPVLTYWPREALMHFYADVADSAAHTVVLGEVVCSRRHEMKLDDWLALARDLAANGKEVVLATQALIESEADLRTLRRIAEQGDFLVEAGDASALQALVQAKLPFVLGPHINVYSRAALEEYAHLGAMRWVAPVEVEVGSDGGRLVERATGAAVTRGRVEKMSKSKKNTIDPEPIVDKYGADAVRWFMLSDSPPERDLEWSIAAIEGAARFVQRVWRLVQGVAGASGSDPALDRKLHRAIAAVGAAIDALQFNKAVASIYELTNAIERAAPSASRDEAVRTLVLLAAPMAPHLAEEAWLALKQEGMIADAPWPAHDPAMLVDETLTLAVQVNGKLRDTVEAARGLAREDAEALALASPKVQAQLGGNAPRKVIVVPDRLVNIVL